MKPLATYAERVGAACILFAVACGGPEEPARQPPPQVDLGQDSRGRMVVAQVDGHPVYEDCVALQLSKGPDMTREAALDECIAFELLARHAHGKGYGAHPEVIAARRKEAVRAFIDEAFWARFESWKDVPEADLRRSWSQVRYKYDHPEYRFTVYVRGPVGKEPRPGESAAEWKARDRAARALAEEIHARLAGERGLTKERFIEIATQVSGKDRKLVHDSRPFNFPRRGRAVPAFADAAFAIPEAGMVSKPTRTRWGWDIILLLSILPEIHKSFEQAKGELAKEIFRASQRLAFLKWTAKLAAGHQIYPDRRDRSQMAEVDQKLRSLAADGPPLPMEPER